MNDASAVKETAEKAQEGLKDQIGQRSKQAGERVSSTASDLRSVGEELRGKGKDGPAKLAERAAEQTEKVGSYLSETEPDRILHDVEDFGRKRPWAMLAGGLVAGAVAARFLKASSRNRYRQRGSTPQRSLSQTTQPTAAPTGSPVRAPAGSPVGMP